MSGTGKVYIDVEGRVHLGHEDMIPGTYKHHRVDFWYPRRGEEQKKIKIELMDVRAANCVVVSYDFDRDGWVIESDMQKPMDEWTEADWNAPEEPDTLTEVAFIMAWPKVIKEKTDV